MNDHEKEEKQKHPTNGHGNSWQQENLMLADRMDKIEEQVRQKRLMLKHQKFLAFFVFNPITIGFILIALGGKPNDGPTIGIFGFYMFAWLGYAGWMILGQVTKRIGYLKERKA